MKTDAYEIERIRRQFALRDYQPNNHRRITIDHWIGYSLITIALVASAGAAIYLRSL